MYQYEMKNAKQFQIVKDMTEAIEHIHRFGSSHTDVIVTEDFDAEVSPNALFMATVLKKLDRCTNFILM